MNNRTRSALFALMAFVALASGQAQATTVTTALTGASYSLSNSDTFNTNLVASDANFTSNALFNVSLSNAAIVSNNVSGSHVLNGGITGGTNYLSVYGNGSATLTFTQPVTSFAFNWGTFDAANSVDIYDVNNNKITVTGSALIAANIAGTTAGTSSLYFSFSEIANIAKIVFSSTSNSFELSNLSVSAVPLPATLPLLGLGLVALVGYGVMKKKSLKA